MQPVIHAFLFWGRRRRSQVSRAGGSLSAAPSALLAEAVSLDRAGGFARRLFSSSIGEVEESILCGRRGVPTISYQKLVGAGAESCPREVNVPDFQGFRIFFGRRIKVCQSLE